MHFVLVSDCTNSSFNTFFFLTSIHILSSLNQFKCFWWIVTSLLFLKMLNLILIWLWLDSLLVLIIICVTVFSADKPQTLSHHFWTTSWNSNVLFVCMCHVQAFELCDIVCFMWIGPSIRDIKKINLHFDSYHSYHNGILSKYLDLNFTFFTV